MICNKCNHTLPNDSVFCQYCGAELEKPAVVAEAPKESTPPVEKHTPAPVAAHDEPCIVDMSPQDALKTILQVQAENTIKAMEQNSLTQPDNESDADFGLIPEKPIFTLATKSVDGEREYLDKLYSINGEKLSYKRRGSLSVDSISGMIDIYDTFLPSGQLYKTIFINMYGAKKSSKVPVGFSTNSAVMQNRHAPEESSSVKTKYCSCCGSVIDSESKVCRGCGKQYYKFQEWHVYMLALAIALILSILINISQLDKIMAYEDLATFVDRYVVCIENDGSELYHKFDCYKFDGESFLVYNISKAERLGYSPCPSCH